MTLRRPSARTSIASSPYSAPLLLTVAAGISAGVLFFQRARSRRPQSRRRNDPSLVLRLLKEAGMSLLALGADRLGRRGLKLLLGPSDRIPQAAPRQRADSAEPVQTPGVDSYRRVAAPV